MKRKFKNILLVLIISLFSFNSFGFVIYFLVVRENIKESKFDEIKRNDSRSRIEILSFNSSDYENGEAVQRINDREIRFQGKMYDIVKVLMHSGTIIIYCIHDEKEDRLEKEFADNMRETNSGKIILMTQQKFISQINYVQLVKKPEISSPIKKCIYISSTKNSHAQKENEVLTPPPKSEFV